MSGEDYTDSLRAKRLPRGVPVYGFFTMPRGLLLKVCAEPCMYAPGYIQSRRPRWPADSSGAGPNRRLEP